MLCHLIYAFFVMDIAMKGEGNGNPLQHSCLENPRDREAWWAAVYGDIDEAIAAAA